jgi:hypothetical protein
MSEIAESLVIFLNSISLIPFGEEERRERGEQNSQGGKSG